MTRDNKPFRVETSEIPDQWIELEIVVEIAFENIEITYPHGDRQPVISIIGAKFIRDSLRIMDKRPEDSTNLDQLSVYAKLNH